ncbi:MAG: GtrA family protein [Methylocella sp.]
MLAAQISQISARARSNVIFVRYVLFAILAGLMNLLTQAIVFHMAPAPIIVGGLDRLGLRINSFDFVLAISILAGTGVGFIIKYVLDKRWIFFDDYDNPADEARKICLYGFFSVGMTFIFWGSEIAFLAIFGTSAAKYIGAVIGLVIGNFAKYLLDRAYTFKLRAETWN